MGTKKGAIVLIILTTVFICLGQIFWKLGLNQATTFFELFNLPLLLGFIFYGFSLVIMILAFKQGELSVLYPILATSYIWISILSPLVFKTDAMNLYKWLGVGMILLGVGLVGRGGKK